MALRHGLRGAGRASSSGSTAAGPAGRAGSERSSTRDQTTGTARVFRKAEEILAGRGKTEKFPGWFAPVGTG